MARKTKPENRREGRGISLLPALWARIDRLAEAQEKSRSEVVEEVLSLHLPEMDAWRRMGGRPKDPTYDEIVAAQAATRREKRRVSTDRRRPSRND